MSVPENIQLQVPPVVPDRRFELQHLIDSLTNETWLASSMCYFKILNLRLVAGNFIGILNQDFWGINLGSVYIQGLNLMKIQ